MIGLAVGVFFAMWLQKYFFQLISVKVTYAMRYTLYDEILNKNIGWFDMRENSVGVLSSAMAQDTSLINGVSSESLGPQVESAFAMLVGVVIGFYFCW
jgi:ATP-binding cassette subfamily B (MDR/TAP) protein 1